MQSAANSARWIIYRARGGLARDKVGLCRQEVRQSALRLRATQEHGQKKAHCPEESSSHGHRLSSAFKLQVEMGVTRVGLNRLQVQVGRI